MSRRPPRVIRRWMHRAREQLIGLRRWFRRGAHAVVSFETLHARLDYYMVALYGPGLTLEPLREEAVRRHWLWRLIDRLTGAPTFTRSESAGPLIRLPAELPKAEQGVSAVERYRMLVAQHAERIVRGSAGRRASAESPLERDLFLIADAAAVNRAIARRQPGLTRLLAEAQRSAAAEGERVVRNMALEREVVGIMRDSLSERMPDDAAVPDAAACAEWARGRSAELAARHLAEEVAEYRGIGPLALWNTVIEFESGATAERQPTQRRDDPFEGNSDRHRELRREQPGQTPPRKAPRNAQAARPEARQPPQQDSTDSAQPGGEADEHAPLAAEEEKSTALRAGARDDQTLDASGLDAVDPAAPRRTGSDRATMMSAGIHYAEWDVYRNDYRDDAAIVRVGAGSASSSAWADGMLREHAVLVRQLRRQFDQMRVDRTHLTRQWRGEELDLEMCVAALVDRRMGRTPDERLYTAVRPGHRPLAIALLVDASTSTGDSAEGGLRVIDVERLALLVAGEAIEALGNEWAAYAFASDGGADVRVTTLKGFTEHTASRVRERVSALEPAGATRLGAAIRHASRELVQRPVEHRLLVILSDGKPQDRDRYDIDYAVADSRRAVIEGRLAGVTTHCITIDPHEPQEYMADIFGDHGYLLVAHPAQLPRALAGAVGRLVK